MKDVNRRAFLSASAALTIPKVLPCTVPVLRSVLRRTPTDQHIELRSGAMHVTIMVGPGGIWLEQLALKRTDSGTDTGFTSNLLHSSGSGSALLLDGQEEWQAAHLGPSGTVQSDASSAHITGILIGPDTAPIAREAWTLTLHGDVLQWHVVRDFLRAVTIRADRFPCLSLQTSEIVSFLDPTAQLRSPGLFPLGLGEMSLDSPWGEMVSSRRAQRLEWSPSGVVVDSELTAGYFSFAKAANNGTVDTIVIGSETVDRTGPPVLRQAGTQQRQEWTLRLRANTTIIPFQLALPDEKLAALARSFAHVKNQWVGWIFGNNPASVSCLTEVAWFPMIQSVYMADPVSMHALDRQLEFFAATGVDPDGYVNAYWQTFGYKAPHLFECFHEQVPHLILAMYEQAVNTGNRAFVQRVMPTLDRIASYLLAMDSDHDGIFEDPNAGLAVGGWNNVDNWYDTILFGHKDALLNIYAVAALHGMAEMKAFLGDAAGAERFREAHARSKAAYNTVFWDDEKGFYMDWIDVHEQMPASGRRYFYTEHSLLAIIYGVANATQAQRILANLDARYEALCQEFHRQRDDIYATPANMYPVTQLGDLAYNGDLEGQKNYPSYENGGAFFHLTGLEIAARGAAGQTEQAYTAFERVMRRGYARNRLWGAELHWTDDTIKYEPLSDALLILWGFAHGCLGIRRTLTGIQAVGGCTPRLEGAKHTFRHLGRNVTVQVRHGRPVLVHG